MKKIAFMHYAYPPKIGGVERLMREHALILADMGYDVLVLAGTGEETNKKITFYQIPVFQAVRQFDQSVQEHIIGGGEVTEAFTKLASTIEAKLEKNLADRDVVIVHNMMTLIHNLPFISAFKAYAQKHPEKRIIVWVHDQTFIDNSRVVEPKSGVTLESKMRDFLVAPIPQAHYVVISQTFQKLLSQVMQIDPAHVHVIPDGIHIKRFMEIDDAIWDIVQKERLLDAFPIILTPVNILERKNLDYCLDVISELVSDYPNTRYIVSGLPSEHRDTGSYFDKLKKKVTDLSLGSHVFFLAEHVKRALTDAELHDLYDIADLVLYFSKQENFGLPILEAALTKAPIWVSNLEVFHEIGGEHLTYVDTATQTPSDVAKLIGEYIHAHPAMSLNYHTRKTYDLETIVREHVVPLVEI